MQAQPHRGRRGLSPRAARGASRRGRACGREPWASLSASRATSARRRRDLADTPKLADFREADAHPQPVRCLVCHITFTQQSSDVFCDDDRSLLLVLYRSFTLPELDFSTVYGCLTSWFFPMPCCAAIEMPIWFALLTQKVFDSPTIQARMSHTYTRTSAGIASGLYPPPSPQTTLPQPSGGMEGVAEGAAGVERRQRALPPERAAPQCRAPGGDAAVTAPLAASCELSSRQPERPGMVATERGGCGGSSSRGQPSLYAAAPRAAETRRQAAHSRTSVSDLASLQRGIDCWRVMPCTEHRAAARMAMGPNHGVRLAVDITTRCDAAAAHNSCSKQPPSRT